MYNDNKKMPFILTECCIYITLSSKNIKLVFDAQYVLVRLTESPAL